jgi:glucose/arabinose dehydrogenase
MKVLRILLASVLMLSLVLVARPGVADAVATVPAGFTASEYASGFGSRLSTMEWSPDGRLFVSEKAGALRVVKNGTLLSQPFLTVSADTTAERGLMGIAFDPAFSTNHFVYIYYTFANTLKNRVSRFTQSITNPDLAQAGSELVLLDNIPSDSGMHNAGALHFGPDGKLYISVGDSGTGSNAQNRGILPGKILRINKDGTVPSDNPYVGQTGRRPEIWAYGLRNPFTFAFQPGTGRMFINDVGDARWEEIDEGQKGANYGWPTCEGSCSNPAFVNPIYQYNHSAGPGKSITGAVFYNGSNFPATYANDYFFGDYVGNYIKRYDMETGLVSDFATNAATPVDLRVGPDGALYYLSVESRRVSRITFGSSPPPPPPPPPGSGQMILTPTADNHTTSGQPTKNYGASPALYVNSTNPIDQAFLKWDLSALAGKVVTSASLRIRTVAEQWAGSTTTQNVRLVQDSSWGEKTMTYNTRPTMTTQLGSISATQPNTSYQITLAPSVVETKVGGLFSIGLESVGASDNLYFSSRDSTVNRPELIIDYTTPAVGQAPVPTISQPLAGTTYRAGDSIAFSGSATDPEDGPLATGRLTWEVLFHHDTHTHPFLEPVSGISGGTLHLPDTGEASSNQWYRIHLRATDSDGNTTEVTRDILPQKADVTVDTVPTGLSVELDGAPMTAPVNFTGVVGFRRELNAPATQVLDGKTYQFVSWSDGGAANHFITTPATNTTYTATYQQTNSVTVTLNPVADNHVSSRSPASNYGLSTALWVVKGESYPYLKFDLTALAGKTITSAVLRVATANQSAAGSPNTISVLVVADTTWGERTLTYANRPPISTSLLGTQTLPAINTSYDVTLSAPLVQGKLGGLFTMALDSSGIDALGINSREASPKPHLIITYH